MKFNTEITKEAVVEICNMEMFEAHCAGELKEHFWDYEDDVEGAIENILHQFQMDGGQYVSMKDEIKVVKFLEGWGEFVRSKDNMDKWIVENEYVGKIVIDFDDSEASYWTREN